MLRRLLAVAVLALAAAPARAQNPQPEEPIRLTLTPSAVPTPSLKYRLLPDRGDLTAGNAATLYNRSLALFFENPALLQDVKEQQWDTWATIPLKDLPRKEVRERVGRAKSLVREVEAAARKRDCDWELDDRPEGAALLIPDVQGFRRVGTVLAVKARLEIAEGDYAQAARTLESGYALARRLGAGPSIIHVLVGAAVANLMDLQLDEWVQRPDAPNLYWSLTVLPRPFLDLDHALQEEQTMFLRTFSWVRKLEQGPMTAADVRAAEEEPVTLFSARRPTWNQRLLAAWQRMLLFPAARKSLLEHGYKEEQLEALPSFQVVAIYAVREYRQAGEEALKWAHVANGWREPGFKEAAERYQEAAGRLDDLFFYGLFRALGADEVSRLDRFFAAVGRTDRRLAALRFVEGVRAYAAAHDGKLPVSLKDVKGVPAPDDPLTGKPFEYAVKDGKATLASRPPEADKGGPVQPLVFELTVRAGK